MTKKYLCPKHREDTPSAVAYSNGYHCFGCGAHGPLAELGLPAGERVEITYVEDLESSISRIKSLPKQKIRGFELHADDRGYYLLWPFNDYYKRRVYGADATNKYRGPSGHKKPPYVVDAYDLASRLVLVEGEFNALSYSHFGGGQGRVVISPGGAGDFYSKGSERHLRGYAKYSQVDIVVDADAAGAQAAIETKAKLMVLGCPDVRVHLVEKDFNDILVQDGKEALREECKRLGLL